MLRSLRGDVRDIKATLANMTMSIEKVNGLVQYYLKQHGISVTGPTRLDLTYKIDIYGTNGQYIIVGEAKNRVRVDVVRRVAARVEETVRRFLGRF